MPRTTKKYEDVDRCMADTDENIRLAALEAKLGYITLDCKSKKLSICKQLSLHQQPMFMPSGQYNPSFTKALRRQQKGKTITCDKLCNV